MTFLRSKNKLFHMLHHECSIFLHKGADRLKILTVFFLSGQSASSLSLSSDFRFSAYACEVLHSAFLSFAHGSQNPTLLPATQPEYLHLLQKLNTYYIYTFHTLNKYTLYCRNTNCTCQVLQLKRANFSTPPFCNLDSEPADSEDAIFCGCLGKKSM